MTTLLTLPREIREQILREALSFERSPPPTRSVSSGRVCLQNNVDTNWARTTNIYVEAGLASSAQTALLQTSRQLRAETQYILKVPDARPYRLDVLLVKEYGLFPTWLSFPRYQKHVDEVYVQMRISDRPKDINEDVYLLGGCHQATAPSGSDTTPDHERDEDDDPFDIQNHNIAKYTIKTLIIDVLGQPSDGADPEDGQHPRNTFGHCIFNANAEFYFPGERVGPAQKLAIEIWKSFELALNFNYPYELYGRLLHENISVIEIHINGVQWTEDNLTSRLCGPSGILLPSDPQRGDRVVEKRRMDGLWDEEVYEELRKRWG